MPRDILPLTEALPPGLRSAALAALVLLALLLVGWGVLRGRGRGNRPDSGAGRTAARTAPAAAPVPSRAARLTAALARTRALLVRSLEGLPSGAERAGWLAAVEEALIVADVGVTTTQALLRKLEERLPPRCATADALAALAVVLRDSLATAAVAPDPEGERHRPHVVLVTGVNGVGKTTTIGKLAARYRGQEKSVLLVAADTFRAAADSQLERWGERTSAAVIRQAPGADPAAVVVDGVRSAIARQIDVVLIDTAGRLHTRTNLMEELRKVRRVVGRECPGAPHETLLVLDATTGQNGLQQARLFREAVDLSGVVLTKMDGTAKGGIVVAVAGELGVPVRFIGLGEGADDLQPFDPAAFVAALLPASAEGVGETAPPA